MASTYNLVFITTDRCLKISLPVWYRRHVTLSVTYSTIANLAWIFGNLFHPLATYGLQEINRTNLTCVENQDFFDSPQRTVIKIISVIVHLILPTMSLIVCYGIILYKIRRMGRVRGKNKVRETTHQIW